MAQIELIQGREILDSRGNPTVEADVNLRDGSFGRAAVPSGASTGEHEAVELRDGDKRRYLGKGVLQAVDNVNTVLAPELGGQEASNQAEIDELMIELDGTPNKSKLGANAILAVSMAVCRAAAQSADIPSTAISADCRRAFSRPHDERLQRRRSRRQYRGFSGIHDHARRRGEFLPSPAHGRRDLPHLKKVLKNRGYNTSVGDEGGFAPSLKSNVEAVEVMLEAIDKADIPRATTSRSRSTRPPARCSGRQVRLLQVRQIEEIVRGDGELYADWVAIPIVSIEDGLAQDDWDGWKILTKELGSKVQLVGDDIFVTNTERLARGIEEG